MEENSNDMFTDDDISWFMDLENNQNQLLRRTPATNGRPEHWEIRRGNYITLGEFFRFGADWLSCFDLYRMYLTFPVFISKKTPQQVEYGLCTVYQECKALEEH